MDYITPQQAAEHWGLKLRTVQMYCNSGRIPGAKKIGKQWFIPDNAVRPLDGRYNENKNAKTAETVQEEINPAYHFPAFVFTEYYSHDFSLNETEKKLLRAQKLTLQSNYVESIKYCKEIMESAQDAHILFGAYGTQMYNYLLLGQYSKLQIYIKAMNDIFEKEKYHQEDFKLIIAAYKFQFNHDSSPLYRIKLHKLSREAINLYRTLIMLVAMFSKITESPSATRVYDTISVEAEQSGNLPVAMIIHTILAKSYEKSRFKDKSQIHIKEAMRIGCSENLDTLIAEYMNMSPLTYKREIYDRAPEKVDPLIKLYQQNYIGRRNIINSLKSASIYQSVEEKDMELFILLSDNMTNASMAIIKDTTEKDISFDLKVLRQKYQLESRSDLSKKAKEMTSQIQNKLFMKLIK